MHKFVFLLKTYQDDVLYVRRLIDSIITYNKDNIPLYVVCPDADVACFQQICRPLCATILPEPLFSKYLATDFVKLKYENVSIRPGYINQEIIKLSFWELGVAENYLCVDSDAEFIRNFYISDFIAPNGVPYTFLTEDRALLLDSYYYTLCSWETRKKRIDDICRVINYAPPYFETSHGNVTFNATVLEHMYRNFMQKNSLTYIDLLSISPYEFSWYNMWLKKNKIIPVHKREPVILYFHHENQLKNYKSAGVTLSDLARAYVGIVVNSNFQHNRGQDKPLSYEDYTDYMAQNDFNQALRFIVKNCIIACYDRIKSFFPTPARRLLGNIKRQLKLFLLRK